jgi:hypothetical protein
MFEKQKINIRQRATTIPSHFAFIARDLFIISEQSGSVLFQQSPAAVEVMVSKFERIFFKPLVYHSFTLKNKESDCDEEFVVQDLPTELHEQAADFMIQYYMKDETFQKAFQVSQESLKEFYRFVFDQKVSIVCLKKGSTEIVGMNALSVKTKGVDTSFQVSFRL